MALRPAKPLARHRGHRVETAAAAVPVYLAVVLELLREPPEDEYSFIEDTIRQAVAVFESITGIACINQTWKLTLDEWTHGSGDLPLPLAPIQNYITLPRYPLSSISAITTYSPSNTATPITTSDFFFLDTNSLPGRLILKDGQNWPVALRSRNSIEISYVAGLGTSPDDVPVEIRRAIGQIISYLYENRGAGCSAEKAVMASGALQIAAEYVKVRL